MSKFKIGDTVIVRGNDSLQFFEGMYSIGETFVVIFVRECGTVVDEDGWVYDSSALELATETSTQINNLGMLSVDSGPILPPSDSSTDPGTIRGRLEDAEKALAASLTPANMEELIILLPKGVTRLEGEFGGYYVTLEKK